MKSIYLLVCLALFATLANAQADSSGVRFIQNDWAKAQSQAVQENKLIFLDIYTDWCGPCKQMDKLVFSKADVGSRFNQTFVNVKINAESSVGIPLAQQYGVISYPTYVFATADGDMIYKVKGAMAPDQLLQEVARALSISRTFRPLEELTLSYQEGERNPTFLYEYLRQKYLKEGRQPDLLEEYVALVPKAEQRTEKVLSIIAKNIESVDAPSFSLLHASLKNFNALTERQQEAVISGITTAKKLTFKRVIESNDTALFERLIDAVYATAYTPDGAKAEARQFRFDYAKITRNFSEYRTLAEEMGSFLVNKTDEELAFETEQNLQYFDQQARARNLSETSQQFQFMRKNLEYGVEKTTAYQLNELAWGYVLMAENKADLERALRWSERSLALYVTPANLDTKAQLQYRLGNRREALKLEKQAIKLGQKLNTNVDSLKESLKRMKKRLPVTILSSTTNPKT